LGHHHYDEYGNITKNTNPDFQPFTYAGGLYDSQTRLVRFGARDYDASVGRWTCKDPIGFGGGVSNIYEYVINNPINYLDLSGKQEIQLSIGGGGTAFIIMGGLHIEVNIGLALNLSDFGQTRLYGQGEFAIMTGLGIAAIASGQASGGGYKEPIKEGGSSAFTVHGEAGLGAGEVAGVAADVNLKRNPCDKSLSVGGGGAAKPFGGGGVAAYVAAGAAINGYYASPTIATIWGAIKHLFSGGN
jgi:RHS repeat-associated protein